MKTQNDGSMNQVRGLLLMSAVVGVLFVTASTQATMVSIVVNNVAGLDSYAPTSSAGGIDAFPIGQASTGPADVGRMLIDFDLSAIPAGSTINSATLRLVDGGGDGGAGGPDYFGHVGNFTTISLRYAAEDQPGINWTTSATWNTYDGVNAWTTAGGGSLGGVLSSLTSDFVGNIYSRVDFSFTGLAPAVQGWLDNPASNRGFLIRNNDESIAALRKYMLWNWYSGTAPHGFPGPVDARPYLDVDFTAPVPEPTSFGLMLLGAALVTRKYLRKK